MEIIKLNGIKIKPNTVATIGFFDGVHLAHKELINKTIEIGNKKHLKKAVITFDVHPKSVLFGLDYHYITPLKRKIEIINKFDIDYIYIIEFTKEKAKLTPHEFINFYLNGLNTLVCGFDFKFGVRGSGNVKTLQEHKEFITEVIPEITFGGYKVGSTHIRDLVNGGLVEKIREVMGYYYSIQGEVIHGAQKGRTIGYPTANIDTKDYLIPKNGVYATITKIDGVWHKSMSSIGHNPTLNCMVDVSVESHIINYDRDLYGKIIKLKFIKRLRDELKFDSVEALVAQIDQDQIDSLEILKSVKDIILA